MGIPPLDRRLLKPCSLLGTTTGARARAINKSSQGLSWASQAHCLSRQ